MKCPKCGSEYFSSQPTCFACSRLERQAAGKAELDWRKAITLLLGAAITALGLTLLLKGPDIVPEDGLVGVVTFAVFVVSFGATIVSYSFLHRETSLREFREGMEPSNRAVAVTTALGLGMMVFVVTYLDAALYFEITPRLFEMLGIVLPVSILLIIAGLYRRPRFLFRTETAELSPSRRTTVGTTLLAIGFGVQVLTFVYGYWKSLSVLAIGWIWFFLIGPLIVILSLVVLWGPMGRPWIPGEHRALGDDPAENK